jgi:ribosomal protein S18 acetylase RimI-like enzyme
VLIADLGYERPAAEAAAAVAGIGADERVVVADVDGAVCGFASAAVVPFFHDGSRRLRLTAVAVSPSHRGRAWPGRWCRSSSDGVASRARVSSR